MLVWLLIFIGGLAALLLPAWIVGHCVAWLMGLILRTKQPP